MSPGGDMSTSQEVSPGQVIEITVLRAATCYFFSVDLMFAGGVPEMDLKNS
jgi:hypothetical protein